MAARRVVRLIATGGTISTTTASGLSAPTISAAALSALVDVGGVEVVPSEFTRQPGWSLDPEEMAEIARSARDAARDPGVTGVVVTHGTTTLEYTAFLADLFLDVPTPVVFTGAMRRADHASPDGPRNLRDAVRVAASARARGQGALLVFAGRVIAGRRSWKARRMDDDAFIDLAGDVGAVTERAVFIRHPIGRGPVFSGRLDPRVGLVKAVPGMNGTLVEAAVRMGIHGLVVEGLPGVGGIPPAMQQAVAESAADMPIAIASRAPFGRLPPAPTGGTGDPLREVDLLSAGDLTAEQAWVLLMVALGEAANAAEAKRLFRMANGTG